MVISRTPFRISFFGGGTDYPAWYTQHGGSVLATTIDKYCYLTCRYLPPFFEHKSRIVYSKVEVLTSKRRIEHPAVRGTLEYLGITKGVEIHHDGDLPARAGLGSSSSFTVGLLHALYALKQVMPGKRRLAMEAIRIEQERLKEHVGSQDQISAAFGGLNRIDFDQEGAFRVHPLILPRTRLEELQRHLMLFFTGLSRVASDVAKDQIQAIPRRQAELKAMQEMVDRAVELLIGQADLSDVGALLHEAWQLKRSLTHSISTSHIDGMYHAACRAGASGGKLLGAGGGGFLLFMVKPERQRKVREALKQFLHVPFRFDTAGSQIIFYEPDTRYSQTQGAWRRGVSEGGDGHDAGASDIRPAVEATLPLEGEDAEELSVSARSVALRR